MIHEKALRKWKSFLQSFFVCIKFPVWHGANANHLNRKLLAKGFPSDMGLWCINSTGNYWRKVSCPACVQWEPPQQETICEKFPVRHGAMMHQLNRKLFAKGFLCGMGKLDSSQQETICRPFPARHVSSVYHLNRKLLVGCGIEIRKGL